MKPELTADVRGTPQRVPPPAALVGALLIMLGSAGMLVSMLWALPFVVFGIHSSTATEAVWFAGLPVIMGSLLILADITLLMPRRRAGHGLRSGPPEDGLVTVALTAYNDESSIGQAVEDFLANPLVKRVVVVDNNSVDNTRQVALESGANVVVELLPGYGQCVHRALREASNYDDTPIVAICEGDMTFRSSDLGKLLAYLPHGDVINGTRIVEQLREPVTQLSPFMYWGNFVGGKLLELKHLGRGTVTDLGTTYKLCRTEFIRDHIDRFNPNVNLEFNAHFLDVVLASGFKLVEVPVTFHNRVGKSKGGNVSNRRALRVGLRMLAGIVLSWNVVAEGQSG